MLPAATSLREQRAAGPHRGQAPSQAQQAGKGEAGRGGKVGHKQDGSVKGKPRCRRSLVSVGERETQAGAAGWHQECLVREIDKTGSGHCLLSARALTWLVRVMCRFRVRMGQPLGLCFPPPDPSALLKPPDSL